ncbi:MAG: tRNA lysidine(34) synthetase TilS, partial [Ignavibacteriota bacterium]
NQGHFGSLEVIHIDHTLRAKESASERKLVQKFCRKMAVTLHCISVDTRSYAKERKLGIEEAARDLRYQNIANVVKSNKFDFVTTAHHAGDQAETVIMNIVRGTGLKGLAGIPQSRSLNGKALIIRPLLEIDREAIRKFAAENAVPFREDSSNSSLDYQRNRIRHLVLPEIERAFEGRNIYDGFSRMTQNIISISHYLDDQVKSLRNEAHVEIPSIFIGKKSTSFRKKDILSAPDFIRRELLLREASSLGGKPILIDSIHSELLESFLNYPSEKNFPISPEILISHNKSFVSVEFVEPPPQLQDELMIGTKILTPIGTIELSKVRSWKKPLNADTAFFKYSSIGERILLLRYWRPGDRMKPFGMKGRSRLVSDILGEAGIKTERLKYFIPVIVFKDDLDHILWIPGIRSAEFGQMKGKSETALKLNRTI